MFKKQDMPWVVIVMMIGSTTRTWARESIHNPVISWLATFGIALTLTMIIWVIMLKLRSLTQEAPEAES